MKKLIIAVALVVASAAPVMTEGFPNFRSAESSALNLRLDAEMRLSGRWRR